MRVLVKCSIPLLMLALLVIGSATALAQTGTITGTVTDSTSGEPLPGVNVVVQELNLGAATGANGQYTIPDVPVGTYALVASFIGYETATIPIEVEEGVNEVDLQLTSRVLGLDNVVVTALGIEREARALGYSIQEVEGEELARVPDVNFISSLTGKVAGANFYSSNSLGGSSRIVLRGISSISGENEPLIVVDGIVVNNANITNQNQRAGEGGYDYGTFASSINPANIKAVSVLKGAAAAALYGSRAANGVIQITTKSGAGTQDIGVTVNTSVMASQVYGLPDYQNEFGGGSGMFGTFDGDFVIDEQVAVDLNGDGTIDYEGPDQFIPQYNIDQSWGPRLDGRPARQWYSWDEVNGLLGEMTPWVAHPGNVENFFRTGVEFNTTVALTQGGDNFNYRVSLGNLYKTGIFPNARLNRSQVSFNGGIDLTDRLRTTVVGTYVVEEGRARPGTGYSQLNVFQQLNTFGHRQIALGPDSYMRDYLRPDGSQRGWNWRSAEAAAFTGSLIYSDNPYWIQFENFETDGTEHLYGKVRVAYDVSDALVLSAEVHTDQLLQRRQERAAVGSANGLVQGDYDEEIYDQQETSGQLRLTYDDQLSEHWSLNAFGATQYRYESFSANNMTTNGGLSVPNVYTLENSVGRPTTTDNFQEQGVFSLYGAANVGWRDLLYLGLTARNDWTSTLPAKGNSYFYPSASLSFVFSSLPALQGSDVLSFGKLRLALARVGSDTRPYQLAKAFAIRFPFEGKPQLSVPNQLNNPNLKPEITTSYEIGTQLQFFNNRLGLDATYYYNTTRNQILAVDVSRSTGYGSILLNAGKITNQGLELALTATPILMERFQWNVAVNWAKNVNEVVELAEPLNLQAFTINNGDAPAFGPLVQARVGHPYGVFFGNSLVYDKSGDLVLLPNGSPVASSERKVVGTFQPDWSAGLSSSVSYEGFSASVTLNGRMGGKIYSLSNLWGLYSGMFEETVAGHVRALGVVPQGVWFPKNHDDDPTNDLDPTKAKGVPFTKRISAQDYFAGYFSGPRAMVLYDASYVQLREVTLAYTLPRQWLAGTPIRNLTVSLTGRNLALLYKEVPNIDPAYAISAGNLQGIEGGQLPPSRAYGFGLRMRF